MLREAGRFVCSFLGVAKSSIELHDREKLSQPVRVGLAAKPVSAEDKFLFHKTTNRSVYDDAIASRPDCDDVILWNEAGEVTESTIANVVVSLAGGLLYAAASLRVVAGNIARRIVNYREN